MPLTKFEIELNIPEDMEIIRPGEKMPTDEEIECIEIFLRKKKSPKRWFRVYKFNGFVEIVKTMDGSKPDIFGAKWLTDWTEW